MNNTVAIIGSMALMGGLAAFNQAPKPAESQATEMSAMSMKSEVKKGKGSGTVTAVDAKAGTVMIDHGDIPELEGPAMKMGFAAEGDVLGGIAVGDKVEFELDWNGQTGEATSIRKLAK